VVCAAAGAAGLDQVHRGADESGLVADDAGVIVLGQVVAARAAGAVGRIRAAAQAVRGARVAELAPLVCGLVVALLVAVHAAWQAVRRVQAGQTGQAAAGVSAAGRAACAGGARETPGHRLGGGHVVRFGAGSAVQVWVEEVVVQTGDAVLRVRSAGRAESRGHVAAFADGEAVFVRPRHALLVAGAASLRADSQVVSGVAGVALGRGVQTGGALRVAGQAVGPSRVEVRHALSAGVRRDF